MECSKDEWRSPSRAQLEGADFRFTNERRVVAGGHMMQIMERRQPGIRKSQLDKADLDHKIRVGIPQASVKCNDSPVLLKDSPRQSQKPIGKNCLGAVLLKVLQGSLRH